MKELDTSEKVNIVRQSRFDTLWRGGTSSIFFSANPVLSCLGSRTQHRTRTCSSRSPRQAGALADALRDLVSSSPKSSARTLSGVRISSSLRMAPFDLYVLYAPDGIEHFAGAWSRHVDVE